MLACFFSSLYDVCSPETFSPALGVCNQYPAFQQCGCPLRAGEVALKDIEYPLPALGALATIVTVSNLGMYISYSRSNNYSLGLEHMHLQGIMHKTSNSIPSMYLAKKILTQWMVTTTCAVVSQL